MGLSAGLLRGLPMMNGRTASWTGEFSRTVQRDLGANVKKIHNSGLIDDLWT